MENFRRYDSVTEKKYNRKGISYLLLRKKADKKIMAYLRGIKGERILEAGIGYGYYKDVYFKANHVTGYDVNPQLGQHLGIEIIQGRADEIAKVGRKFDRVLSFYMTEYLNPEELKKFLDDSVDAVIVRGGYLLRRLL